MSSGVNPGMTLGFDERGFAREFEHGAIVTPLVAGEGDTPLMLDQLPAACAFEDVALYAATVAVRFRRQVGFDFNGIRVAVAPELDYEKAIPEIDEEAILRRFERVSGFGNLTKEEKIDIGTKAAVALYDYRRDLRAR